MSKVKYFGDIVHEKLEDIDDLRDAVLILKGEIDRHELEIDRHEKGLIKITHILEHILHLK